MNKTIAICDLCERGDLGTDWTIAFDLPGGRVHVCRDCQEKPASALINLITASLKKTPWQTCRCRFLGEMQAQIGRSCTP